MPRVVITSAQNYTPVFKKGLATLKNFCNHNEAEFIVMPFLGKKIEESTWSPHLNEYFFLRRVDINKNLIIDGTIPINFQAADPVSGFNNVSGSSSLIVPGTRHRLKVIPVQRNALPKVIMSTPTITKPNYRDSLAGWKAEKLHQYGAIYLEYNDKGLFHFRQLTIHPRSGVMYDLNKKYTPDEVSFSDPLAIIMGDTHVPNHDLSVFNATFGKDGLVEQLKPQALIWHDLLDFSSASHHTKGNHQKFIRSAFGKDDVAVELDKVCEVLSSVSDRFGIPQYIVASNHNEHLTKWLDGEVPQDKNSMIWHWLNYEICSRAINHKKIIPLEIYYNCFMGARDDLNFLTEDESLVIGKFELGIHGHLGVNGARAGINSYHNTGVPTVTGHTHSPQIFNGSYCVGTNSHIDMGYNKGLSSWLHSDCLVYPYGGTLINFINGDWRF